MATVTVTLINGFLTPSTVWWSPLGLSVGTDFSVDEFAQILSGVGLAENGNVHISINDTNARFNAAFEASGRFIFTVSDGETLVVSIANADMTEPYEWLPPNHAEVVAFAAHIRSLNHPQTGITHVIVTLTLTDNHAPIANAGPAQTVNSLETVTLDATGSSDPENDPLSYEWTQVAGPTVVLTDADTAQPTFEAPIGSSQQTLSFRATVTETSTPDGFSNADTVTITVRAIIVSPTANPSTINHNGTTALSATLSVTDSSFTYRWTASAGGVFSAQTALNTDWTSPSSVILATVVDLTLTVLLAGVIIATGTVQVIVRAQTSVPLALPAYADQASATGNTIDLTIASATDGRAPYSYAYADLPEELGAIGRRIRGRLITPGVKTVTVTVTDANGDTATATFDWTVTGAAILPPSGINVRIDWGRSFFARDEANVTRRIRSGISASRGRTINSAILGRTAAGRLSFQLDNSDGLYDLENTLSPLHGLIEPGVLVQLRDGGEPMWTGVLDSIPTEYDDVAGQHRANVTALGIYSTLRDATVQEGSLEPASTIQAFCDLLAVNDACGVPDPSGLIFPDATMVGNGQAD